jgi:hypothetical protein
MHRLNENMTSQKSITYKYKIPCQEVQETFNGFSYLNCVIDRRRFKILWIFVEYNVRNSQTLANFDTKDRSKK